jgi:hypothetical protein
MEKKATRDVAAEQEAVGPAGCRPPRHRPPARILNPSFLTETASHNLPGVLPATSSKCCSNPRFLSQMASYHTASNIWQTLEDGGACSDGG